MSTIDSKRVAQRGYETQIKPKIAPRVFDRSKPLTSRPHSTNRAGSANFCRPRS